MERGEGSTSEDQFSLKKFAAIFDTYPQPSHLAHRTPDVPHGEVRGNQRPDLECVEAARGGRLGIGVGVRKVEEESEELEVFALDFATEDAGVEQGRYSGGKKSPPRVAVVGSTDDRSVEGQESRMQNLRKK